MSTNHRNLRGYRWDRRPCPHCGKVVAVNMRLLSQGRLAPIRAPHSRGECRVEVKGRHVRRFKAGMAVRIGRYKRVLVERRGCSDGHGAGGKAWLIDEPVDRQRLWREGEMKPWG